MPDDHRPDEFVLNPTPTNFVQMDKVSRNLTSLVKSQVIQLKNQDSQLKNQDTQLKIQESLDSKFNKLIEIETKNNEILQYILKEQKDSADEGEVMRKSGTVTTTEFTIIDTIREPGHPVKAFELINDSVNSIYVGFNVVSSSTGANLTDVTSDLTRYDLVATTESIIYRFNRNKIKNIYLLATVGNSTYRLKLIW